MTPNPHHVETAREAVAGALNSGRILESEAPAWLSAAITDTTGATLAQLEALAPAPFLANNRAAEAVIGRRLATPEQVAALDAWHADR